MRDALAEETKAEKKSDSFQHATALPKAFKSSYAPPKKRA